MFVYLDVMVFLDVEWVGHMVCTACFKNKRPSELSAHCFTDLNVASW